MNHSIKAAAFHLNLFIEPHMEHLQVSADKIKMESIIVNLLQNSLKYGNTSEPIKIELNTTKSVLSASFENKIDLQKQIQSGNGLGLWICGQLSEKQGFSFIYKTENGYFKTVLSIPINAHN